MAKYDPLGRFLRRRRHEDVRLSFDEIERIIGAMLPHAADDPVWWANDPPRERGFIQCRAWLEAGYRAQSEWPLRAIVFRANATASVSSAGERLAPPPSH